jgi:N-acetylmuramoyl-L-alanine amidase CwlA
MGDTQRVLHNHLRGTPMTTYPPPDVPYRGPAAHAGELDNKPVRRIVLHSTVSPCVPGGAEAVARYFRSPQAGGSAHYVVDPATTVQVVYDSRTAYHAPPNQHSLGIEMCDMPSATSSARWRDTAHQAMLDRVARLTAELCLAYGVPVRYRNARGLRRGEHGITTHHEVSMAFGQSTHWDPGKWPRRRFMRLVRSHVHRMRKEAK